MLRRHARGFRLCCCGGVMVLDELALHLQVQGFGMVGTFIFKGGIPLDDVAHPVADSLIALRETGGLAPAYAHDTEGPGFERPTVQVVVRAAPYAYQDARNMAQRAFTVLGSITNQVLEGTRYLWVRPLQSPFALPLDAHARPIIVFNVLIAKGLSV